MAGKTVCAETARQMRGPLSALQVPKTQKTVGQIGAPLGARPNRNKKKKKGAAQQKKTPHRKVMAGLQQRAECSIVMYAEKVGGLRLRCSL